MQLRLVIAFLLLASSAWAESVPLAWDASVSPNIAGYKVYTGTTSRTYGTLITIGNVTTYTVPGLPSGFTYYFAVTAFDASGNESDFSNEVSKTLGGVPISPPVVAAILSISVPAITTQYATITWTTSTECSGTAYYGTAEPLTKSVKANNLGTTDHNAVIGPLVTKTHYLFRVESICNGTTINSGTRSFNSK